MTEKRACPYCGVVLDPVPTRSRKCPDCDEKIVLRTDSPTKKKLLLTEIEASEFDEKKKAKSSRNKVLRNLWFLDDAEKEYNAMEVELGAGFKPGDIFWALANRQTLELELNPSKNAKEINMFPIIKPEAPTTNLLKRNGRHFPPNYLHESWRDFLYWDTELES